METATKDKTVYGTFLQNRIVSIKPVESSGKWSNLLVQGQERLKDPFMYNKTKRSYQVPLNSETRGGGVKVILDDMTRIKIQKYMESHPNGMTQKEFFEKELGVDLNPTLPVEKNFWRSDRRGRVILTKEGATLNLNLPLDMLKYLILISNKMLISPSYEERVNKATYEFMVVDENKITSKKLEEADLKLKRMLSMLRLLTVRLLRLGLSNLLAAPFLLLLLQSGLSQRLRILWNQILNISWRLLTIHNTMSVSLYKKLLKLVQLSAKARSVTLLTMVQS